MKKLILFVCAFFVASSMFAQTLEELKASKDRLIKMESLKALPKLSGLANTDALTGKCGKIVNKAIELTPILLQMYNSVKGKNAKGEADASVKKPILADVLALQKNVTDQATQIKEASEMAKGAVEELKTIKNPLKLKDPTACLNYSKDVLKVAGEESLFQGKCVADILKSLK